MSSCMKDPLHENPECVTRCNGLVTSYNTRYISCQMPKQGVWLGGQLGGGVAYRGMGHQRKKRSKWLSCQLGEFGQRIFETNK